MVAYFFVDTIHPWIFNFKDLTLSLCNNIQENQWKNIPQPFKSWQSMNLWKLFPINWNDFKEEMLVFPLTYPYNLLFDWVSILWQHWLRLGGWNSERHIFCQKSFGFTIDIKRYFPNNGTTCTGKPCMFFVRPIQTPSGLWCKNRLSCWYRGNCSSSLKTSLQ